MCYILLVCASFLQTNILAEEENLVSCRFGYVYFPFPSSIYFVFLSICMPSLRSVFLPVICFLFSFYSFHFRYFHILLPFFLGFLLSFHFPFLPSLLFSFLPYCLPLCVLSISYFAPQPHSSCILLRFPYSLLKQTVSCLEWSVCVKFPMYTCHSLTGACLRSESFSASIFVHSSLNIEAMYIGNRSWHLKSFKISTCIDNYNPYSDLHVNRDLSLTTRKRSMKWHWRHS